jgi:sporulation protein YqfC
MRKLRSVLAGYMTENLKMPKDLVYGDALISITGRHELYIENYRSIIEYSNTQVKLQTKNGKLLIIGKQLQIVYYTSDEMKIIGYLSEIKYE